MSKPSFNTSASMESDLHKLRCQFQKTPKEKAIRQALDSQCLTYKRRN